MLDTPARARHMASRAYAATVIKEELRMLPAGRAVYERQSSLFFLSDRATATANAEANLATAVELEKQEEAEQQEAERSRTGHQR